MNFEVPVSKLWSTHILFGYYFFALTIDIPLALATDLKIRGKWGVFAIGTFSVAVIMVVLHG